MPIPTHSLRKILRLILQENSFEFNDKNYLQIHGTAMGTKMAVAFANTFMASVETKIINQSKTKPLEWKRYIDDIFSLWNADKEEIEDFFLSLQTDTTLQLNLRLKSQTKKQRREIPQPRNPRHPHSL